jgi:chromosome segregation ATPase
MPIETTLLALPLSDLAVVAVLLVVCCVLGWHTRRIATAGEEAAIKRSLLDAKGAVPLLESAVRNREQRVESLTLTVKGLKDRVSELETSMRQKEIEIDKRDREIRSLSSELTVLKQGTSNGHVVLLDGEDEAADSATADPEMAKRYAALEARYDALARGLFQRDDRIAELEEQLKNPAGEVPTRTLEHEVSELEQTASTLRASLEEKEQQLELLQTRLQEEAAQRETFEDLAKRRSDSNRELKAAAARFEQQIPALMETIKSRDAQIVERDDKLVALTRSLKTERQLREAREAEIEDLQGQLATLQSRQRELQQRLNEQDEAAERTVAAFENTIKDRDFRIAVLTKQTDEQRQSLEQAMAEQQLALADREVERNELAATAAALSRTREQADALTRHVACLTDSLAHSDRALRQQRCATLLLVARFGTTPLLLPAPIGTRAAG